MIVGLTLAAGLWFGAVAEMPVAVQTQGADPAPAVRDWLLVRLFDEGEAVTRDPAMAGRVLTLDRGETGWALSAAGTPIVRVDESPEAPDAVVRLELLHHATTMAATSPTQVPQGAATEVGLTVIGPVSSQTRDAVALAVLAEGFTLSPTPLPSEPTVCLVAEDSALGLTVRSSDKPCGRPETLVAPPTTEAASAQLGQAAVQMVHRFRDPTFGQRTITPQATAEPHDIPPLAVRRRGSVTEHRFGPHEARLQAGAGVSYRAATEAAVRTTLRFGRSLGPAAMFDAVIMPSAADQVDVVDATVTGGLGWRAPAGKRLRLGVGATTGVLVHTYQVGRDRGRATDWAFGFPFEIGIEIKGGLMIHATALVNVSVRSRRHVADDGTVLWSRPRAGITGTLGLSYGWDLQ